MEEIWVKAYTPWGSPCSAAIKDGKVIKARASFGKIAEKDLPLIKIAEDADSSG